MPTKWLDMALNRQKHESPNGKTNGAPQPVDHATPEVAASQNLPSGRGGKEPIKFLGDLQPLEDVSRSAGIMNPRMGYSVTKVMEMLNNDHIRNLPDEAKRAAVLMALDAAELPLKKLCATPGNARRLWMPMSPASGGNSRITGSEKPRGML